MRHCRLVEVFGAAFGVGLAIGGCGTSSRVRPQMPNDGRDPTALARCSVAKSQSSPLVTEWPASEKANLESRLREGAVVVAYAGCEMRLLPQCKAGGSYQWRRTTLSEDAIEIRSEDDLYAKLPLGAAALESELKSSGRLTVRTTVAGQMKLEGAATADIPRTGDCAGATHVITGLSVGAFRLLAGGAASASAGASVGGLGAAGATRAEQVLVRKSGDPARCADATSDQPSPECQSPIQVFLWPLPAQGEGEAAAFADGATGAPGALRVNFVLPEAGEKWRAMKGQTLICDLPCSRWVVPGSEISLRRDGAMASDSLEVVLPKDLGGYSAGREIDAVPEPKQPAAELVGVLGLSLGLGVSLTGGVMWGIGTGSEAHPGNPSTARAGLIMAAAGLPVLATGIYFAAISHDNRVALSLSPEQSVSLHRPNIRFDGAVVVVQSAAADGPRVALTPVGAFGSF